MLADKIFYYRYSQIDEHKPAEFCSLALKNSLRLDLGLGYFSSASFHVLANGMAQFIVNGGKMNLYINQYMSEEDYELFKGKYDNYFDKRLVSSLFEMQKAFTTPNCTPDTLPTSEAIKDLHIEYTNMLTAIIDLLDGAKYLWEGDCHEQ